MIVPLSCPRDASAQPLTRPLAPSR
jgi:hypothetical protein